MNLLNTRRYPRVVQLFISIASVIFVSTSCFLFSRFIGYNVVALVLLVTVSMLAMLVDIMPVLTGAVMSALILNFFFIPPLFTFHIDTTEDLLLFLMYFVIAGLNTVLTFKIRIVEKKVRDKEEKEITIKLYNTLLNSLSHEMRTPLSAIIGAIDTLKESQDVLSQENRSALLDEISIASMRLNRQVENLLNMNRLESGLLQLKKDWCDMNEMISSVTEKFSLAGTGHKIEFVANDDLPLMKVDAGLMEQVLNNLIHNAIQYTPPATTIHIEDAFRSDSCIITIADNGGGFPPAEINFVFDKFYRLPGTKSGGTGLGLSIARGFVEAHKGQIILENNSDGGATFTIILPAESSFINKLKNE